MEEILGESRPRVGRWAALALAAPLAWWTLSLAASGDPWCFLDLVNLAFHEAGHLIFRPFGSTLHVLGGTLGQMLVPLLLAGWFLLREGSPLGAAACLWWTGENLINVARYMADARELRLPLVGGGDHDWNEIFYRFGCLTEPAVSTISTSTRCAGILVMLAGLAWCAAFALPRDMRDRLGERLARLSPRLAALLG